MNMFIRLTASIASLLLLFYLLVPGPNSITAFDSLPEATKSTLSGDTVEVPNVKAYFSDNYRNYVIPFYRKDYASETQLPFYPLRFNHPPEYAFTYIKDQTHSTYLEELTYPLRSSLFVNGLEPFNPDGTKKFTGATEFEQGGELFETKVTLRFYPSSLSSRLITWIGINISFYLLYVMSRKIMQNEN